MPADDDESLPAANTGWAVVRNYVEPIVAELDSPDATLLDLRVVIPGNDAVSLSAEFHGTPSPSQRVALLRYAARLVENAAQAQSRGGE